MGKAPCCDKNNVKRGPWSPEEDDTLRSYIHQHGTGGNWIAFPKKAGLRRCGKSCRLRWLNYLRPDIRHGCFTEEEDIMIYSLYSEMGSRWSVIASQLHGRTDNDVKNHWNTKLKKKLFPKTIHNGNVGENPTPSQPYNTLSNIESYEYNLDFSTLQTQDFHAYSTSYGGLKFPQFNVNHEVKSEAINGINDGILMDFGLGFSNEFGNYGFRSQENKGSEFEGDGHSNLGSSLGHSMLYDDEFRPQGLLQSVVNQ